MSLHLVAAIGATGIFVAAAAVGANQARPPDAPTTALVTPAPTRVPILPRRQATSVPRPERSIAGTIQQLDGDAIVITNLRGQEWRVTPAPGALLRLNGKSTKLDTLQVGDGVVVLGQAQGRREFLAHAITARRK